MTDFEGNELQIGDGVVFARNKFKTTKLVRGVVSKVDIKQANMIMAEVEFQYGETTSKSRVASWNIMKVSETIEEGRE